MSEIVTRNYDSDLFSKSFIVLATEITLLMTIFAILVLWVVENNYECAMSECFVCPDATASYICTSFMKDADQV